MVIVSKTIGEALSELQRTLRDVHDSVTSDKPEWLRDAMPRSSVGKLNQELGRASCRFWAANADNYPGGVNGYYERVCEPYLQDIGVLPDPGKFLPPFTGGQCLVRYKLGYGAGVWTDTLGQDFPKVETFITSRDGPIETWRLFLDGTTLKYEVGGPNVAPPFINTIANGILNFTTPAIVERQDGQPDNCGNPASDYTPPAPTSPPDLAPYVFNPDGDMNVQIDEVTINNDGTINIGINGDPTVVINPAPSRPETLPPGDIGEPDTPVPVGEGSEIEGEAPEGTYLVGVLIALVSAGVGSRPDPQLYGTLYRGACYVYLGGDNGLEMQPQASICLFPEFFFAPEFSNRWKVYANVGYDLLVTPYYRQEVT